VQLVSRALVDFFFYSLDFLFDSHGKEKEEVFECPICYSLICELPAHCQVCSTWLASPPHLAKSYHHLFPPKPFNLLEEEEG